MADPTEYLTRDLQHAAFLKAIGHELVRLEGPPGSRVFVFRNVPADDIAAYHRGTRLVNPYELFTAYRALKRLVFA
jgi:hypothetical protein